MSTWGKVILTKQGEALLNQCLGMSGHYNLNQSNDPDSDTKGIVITRVSTGRYRYTNTSVEYLKERTDLATSDGATGGTSGFVENLNITGLKPITSSNSDQYGQALIQVQLDNQREDRNIKEEYPLGQLGVFARLEGSTEEILFTIVQYAGDTLPVIPAPVTPTLLNFGFYIAIATTETVSIEMEFTGIVTAKQFDDYKLVTDETLNTLNEHTKNTENPHKVTAQQVGLGNVPNVTTNNQTPTFTAASSRTNINSGETLATIFGKIKKWFSDLKTIAFTGSYTDLLNKPTSMQNPNSLTLTMNGSSSSYDGSATASKSWYAPTSGGPAGYNLISNGSGAPVWQQLPYAVCNTSGSTVAKTVSITNFKLVTGVRVFIKFTYAHDSTTKATLNVNNTGAKSIRYKGYGVFKGYNGGNNSDKQYPNTWEAGEIVEFIYDGTEWVSILEKRKIDHSNIVVGTINVDGYRIPPSINDVDFMCGIDGKSDVEVIQEAINASRNGSRIIFKKGNYSIDAPIYMYSGNHACKLSGEQTGDRPKLKFSNNGIITSRSSSSDSKASYPLYFENIAMELIPQLCIEAGSIYFDNVFSRLDVTTAQNLGSTPIKSSGLFKVENGSSIDLWIRSSSSYICYCGIDCTKIEIDDSSVTLQNECSSTQSSGGDDLNFIYNTNATGYIRNSKLTGQGNGRTNFTNGQVTIDECDITLKNRNHSLCHYTTNTEQKLCSLRDCTINYTASTYLTFGKIEGCFFINKVTTDSSSENNKLQILCPTQMIGNTFIGRSEMNFNSNKVQFIGNAMQYSQSYTSFPTGSVNTGTMITG